jgi:orotidine-5'-phosphate decarboxylase
MSASAKEKIIVALDVPDAARAHQVLEELEGAATWCKIGMELFTREGPPVVEIAIKRGFQVFLDLKFHDIPNTVASGVRSAVSLGVRMLTIHTGGGPEMIAAATGAAAAHALVLGVTVLTSSDAATLKAVGLDTSPSDQAVFLAQMGVAAGLRGLVCSPLEIHAIRAVAGHDVALVTPGVRPAGSDAGDQKRIMTPGAAIREGADWLVVGRPIIGAPDRRAAFESIASEMETALAG